MIHGGMSDLLMPERMASQPAGPIDREKFLGGFTSIFLGRGSRLLPGYGIYVSSERIVGVRSWKRVLINYLLLMTVLFIFTEFSVWYFAQLSEGIIPPVFLTPILSYGPALLITILSTLGLRILIDRALGRGPPSIESLPTRRDFEADRESIREIEIVNPLGSISRLGITLRSSSKIELWISNGIFWPRERIVDPIIDVIQQFCGNSPIEQTNERLAW